MSKYWNTKVHSFSDEYPVFKRKKINDNGYTGPYLDLDLDLLYILLGYGNKTLAQLEYALVQVLYMM